MEVRPWAVHMRRCETAYWVAVCKALMARGEKWTLRGAEAISGVSKDTIKRRLKLMLDGSGESTGAWLTKAAKEDDWQ